MAIPLEKVLSKLSPADRAEVDTIAKELIEEELTLRDLRRAQDLTQKQLAEVLGIEQDNVSRLERRADMLLSTMSSYVKAMGGSLRLIAEFPDRSPVAIRLVDLMEKAGPRRKQAREVAALRGQVEILEAQNKALTTQVGASTSKSKRARAHKTL